MVANVREMVSIIPAIFVLLGLADVYVPRETVVKYMGEKSALIGALLAILGWTPLSRHGFLEFKVGPLSLA